MTEDKKPITNKEAADALRSFVGDFGGHLVNTIGASAIAGSIDRLTAAVAILALGASGNGLRPEEQNTLHSFIKRIEKKGTTP